MVGLGQGGRVKVAGKLAANKCCLNLKIYIYFLLLTNFKLLSEIKDNLINT
jgi:hypothetical protein